MLQNVKNMNFMSKWINVGVTCNVIQNIGGESFMTKMERLADKKK